MIKIKRIKDKPLIDLIPYFEESSNSLSVSPDIMSIKEEDIMLLEPFAVVGYNSPDLIFSLNNFGEIISIDLMVNKNNWRPRKLSGKNRSLSQRCFFAQAKNVDYNGELNVYWDKESNIIEVLLSKEIEYQTYSISNNIQIYSNDSFLVGFSCQIVKD